MRPPTAQFGDYRIRYRQVPYVERFFFVDIKRKDNGKWDKEFMKICSFQDKYTIPLWKVFGFLQSEFIVHHNFTSKTYTRLVAFMNKVKRYDSYLDGKN